MGGSGDAGDGRLTAALTGSREAPIRITWAVELLDLTPSDRVLEIGCGPGVAASLVADRLVDGHMTAIDRSPTAIARARARTGDHLASGRLRLEQSTLAEFRSETRFDKAFSINVNVFWTATARAECEALSAALVPGGVVHLVYEGRPGDRGSDVSESVVGNLNRKGFTTTVLRGPQPSLVCITGRPT